MTVISSSSSGSSTGRSHLLDNIGDKPNQPISFKFPKQKFGQTNPVFRSIQPAWLSKWPWLHYDKMEDKMFFHTCCQALKQGSTMRFERKKDIFLTVGYTNWKDASGEKKGGFPTHERSEVCNTIYCKSFKVETFCGSISDQENFTMK